MCWPQVGIDEMGPALRLLRQAQEPKAQGPVIVKVVVTVETPTEKGSRPEK